MRNYERLREAEGKIANLEQGIKSGKDKKRKVKKKKIKKKK